jgi:hypothetical protein
MGRTYGGRRSRVRIDTRAARANMRAALHIQLGRPNDRVYRAPHWNKHSLGQWVEIMGVGDPECALMRALRAQTCAQPCTSSIDGQTTGHIEYRDGTGCSNCRECEVRVCGACCAHIAHSAEKNKIVAYSQTDTGARTSDPPQPNFCPTPD